MKTIKEMEEFSKKIWKDLNIYKSEINLKKEKKVILDFFPYPSGAGLHVGHVLGYVASDIYSRFQRSLDKNVLFAMGFDSFGLPAEQYAIETGNHPSVIVNENINNMKKQLDLLGLSHDKERSFTTTDVEYYKWTQWIFIKIFNSYYNEETNKAEPIEKLEKSLKEKGLKEKEITEIINKKRLVYLDEIEVNWCPKLGTVLSHEEIVNGLSERGNHPVVKKKLTQWVMQITKYSNRLIENLEALNWPESIKEMQRNWIGLSEGALVEFEIINEKEKLEIYTTRLETIDGISFIAISKEHFLASQYNIQEKEFDAIFINKFIKYNEKEIPIYIADYVLEYGTGAVMGVPAHDERDFQFAIKNNINFFPVIVPDEKFLKELEITKEEFYKNCSKYACYTKKNNNDFMYNGKKVLEQIEEKFLLKNVKKKQFTRLRDWIFSRQRYWGEPFPIIFDEENNPLAVYDLPVNLPSLTIKPQVSEEVHKPLDDLPEWKNIKFIKINQFYAKIVETDEEEIVFENIKYKVQKGTRETNTMPNWAGSCWYYLRYADVANKDKIISDEAMNYWMKPEKTGSVDLYLGGAEHAVMHLLYARFWHMILHDLDIVNAPEPFERLFNQGMMLGPAYQNSQGKYFHYKDIKNKNSEFYSISSDEKLFESIGKIGKRYKNGVSPEEVCNDHGIDALRLFIMYLGPLEQNKPWNYTAIQGMKRFLENVIKINITEQENEKAIYDFNIMQEKILQDMEKLKFNTAISSLIIFVNKHKELTKNLYKNLLIILSYFAPHICEFLYQKHIKEKQSINLESFPEKIKTNYIEEKTIIIIQLNGKKKEEIILEYLMNKEKLEEFLEVYKKENQINPKKTIVIEKKFYLINFII